MLERTRPVAVLIFSCSSKLQPWLATTMSGLCSRFTTGCIQPCRPAATNSPWKTWQLGSEGLGGAQREALLSQRQSTNLKVPSSKARSAAAKSTVLLICRPSILCRTQNSRIDSQGGKGRQSWWVNGGSHEQPGFRKEKTHPQKKQQSHSPTSLLVSNAPSEKQKTLSPFQRC